jgi:hypothetical protein
MRGARKSDRRSQCGVQEPQAFPIKPAEGPLLQAISNHSPQQVLAQIYWRGKIPLECGPPLHAVMHLQIVEADGQLIRRYVASGPHRPAMWYAPNRKPHGARN